MGFKTGETMNKIGEFMKKHLEFLQKEYDFKVISLKTSNVFGGDSVIRLEGAGLIISISTDRGYIYIYFQGVFDEKKNNWYDLDIVESYINNPSTYYLGKQENPSDPIFQRKRELKEARFIKDNIHRIIEIFSKENIKETTTTMNQLRTQRGRLLFPRKKNGKQKKN